MPKTFILGASGTVGNAIISQLGENHDHQIFGTYFQTNNGYSKEHFFKVNVSDITTIKDILHKIQPQIVISALRGDYQDQLILHEEVAKFLAKTNGKMYFCSTGNVFDGDPSKPHYEDDQRFSTSEYGQFKINCENKLTSILGENVIIFRFGPVWGQNSKRFRKLVNGLKNHEKIEVFSNVYHNRSLDVILAKQITYVIDNDLRGVFHLGATDVMSESNFFHSLITKLGFGLESLQENTYSSHPGQCFFVTLFKRKLFPESYYYTNQDIIEEMQFE